MPRHATRPACVLVFSGLDPSGGAGMQADVQAISAAGAHTLPIITALTVQDNEHVHAVQAVEAALLQSQFHALHAQGITIDAVKIGIVGSAANAQTIADAIFKLRAINPTLPVVLDPVLASGHGDTLTQGDAVQALAPLRKLATLITPNLPEARALCYDMEDLQLQSQCLLMDTPHVLIKGGHASSHEVINRWFHRQGQRSWQWQRLHGAYHGSGCTLASAIAARLAQQVSMETAISAAQEYTQHCLAHAYAIAAGQWIPHRLNRLKENA